MYSLESEANEPQAGVVHDVAHEKGYTPHSSLAWTHSACSSVFRFPGVKTFP